MKVCIVWVDDPTTTYTLEFEGEALEKVKKCHGMFTNSGPESAELKWLQALLDGKSALQKDLEDEPAKGPFDFVVVCGFLL